MLFQNLQMIHFIRFPQIVFWVKEVSWETIVFYVLLSFWGKTEMHLGEDFSSPKLKNYANFHLSAIKTGFPEHSNFRNVYDFPGRQL